MPAYNQSHRGPNAPVRWQDLENMLLPGHPGYVDGRYYHPIGMGGAVNTSTAIADDWLFALPFRIAYSTVITRLGCQVATAYTGAADVLMGIYSNVSGLPSSLLVSGSEVSIATTGEKEATISYFAQIGWYWLAWTFEDDDGGLVRFNVRTASNSFNPEWGTENGNESGGILRVSRTYNGSLPATFPAVTGADIDTANIPDMWWRKGV